MAVKIKIDKEKCKGCELCVTACPKNVLRMSEKTNKNGYHYAQVVNKENCIACGFCFLVCPDVCIEIKKGDKK